MIIESELWDYDKPKRRYILTEQGVLELTGYNIRTELKLQTNEEVQRELDKVSRDTYKYSEAKVSRVLLGQRSRKQKLEYVVFLNNNDEVETITQAMSEQVEYVMQTGGNLMVNEYQFNNQLITDEQRIEMMLSPVAKVTLKSGGLINKAFNVFIPDDVFRVDY